jgi:hypothetical protein
VDNVQRLLRGKPEIDQPEVELIRARSLERIAALTNPHRTDAPAQASPPDDSGGEAGQFGAAGTTEQDEEGVDQDLGRLTVDAADNRTRAVGPEPIELGPGRPGEPAASTGEAVATDAAGLWSAWPPTDDESVRSSPGAEGAMDVVVDDDVAASPTEREPDIPVDDVVAVVELAAEPSTAVSPHAEPSAYCPYCATLLEPPPKVTRRCARCRQRIVVKHVGERTVYLAEAALPVFEAEQRRTAMVEGWARVRDYWLQLALANGASTDRIAKATAEPATEARIAAARSLYLSAVDRAFESAVRGGRWQDAARIRGDESLVLFDYAGVPVPGVVDGPPAPAGWSMRGMRIPPDGETPS